MKRIANDSCRTKVMESSNERVPFWKRVTLKNVILAVSIGGTMYAVGKYLNATTLAEAQNGLDQICGTLAAQTAQVGGLLVAISLLFSRDRED